jgi:phage head maturation protease
MNLYTSAVIKSVKDEGKRIIYAKISDAVLDRDGEIIRLSAWRTDQLNEFLENSGALLLSHQYQKLPIGKILRFDKKSSGLYMEAQIIEGTEAAEEAWTVISQIGKIGFSVGFRPRKYKEIQVSNLELREKESAINAGFGLGDQIRVWTDVDLLEVSLVSVPSLASATLQAYKSGKLKNAILKKACQGICDTSDTKNIAITIPREAIAQATEASLLKMKRKLAAFDDEEIDLRDREAVAEAIGKAVEEVLPKTIEKMLSPERVQKEIRFCVDKIRGKVY